MSKVTSISFDKPTKISKKLEAKLRALAEAAKVIEANKLTRGERIATLNRLEELWADGAQEHLPDVADYLAILREGQQGWEDSQDYELAEGLFGLFGSDSDDELFGREEQQ